MIKLKAGLTLRGSEKQLASKIINAFARELDKNLGKNLNQIALRISEIVFDALRDSDTYRSLAGGDLRGEVGLLNSKSNFEEVFKIWQQNMVVTKRKFGVSGGSIQGGFKIQMIKSNYEDVINNNSSVFTSENGHPVPWLQWLLMGGNRFLVRDYHIVKNLNTVQQARSRTGEALMNKGGQWRIPSHFQGTLNNNFVTQTIAALESPISKTINGAIGI